VARKIEGDMSSKIPYSPPKQRVTVSTTPESDPNHFLSLPTEEEDFNFRKSRLGQAMEGQNPPEEQDNVNKDVENDIEEKEESPIITKEKILSMLEE